jgi:hypothetical protein
MGQLNKTNSIFIYGLSDTSQYCYLDINKKLEQDKSSRLFVLYLGTTFLLIGFIILLYRLKLRISKT